MLILTRVEHIITINAYDKVENCSDTGFSKKLTGIPIDNV